MQNLIPITAFENMSRIKYRKQLILTTAQIAEFYGTSPIRIQQNFNSNSDKFIEGNHYFKVEGNDLENLRFAQNELQISPMTRVLYLWTKRGAARHAKMLNTDRAWDVFELLEAAYFEKAAEKEKPLPEEKPPIENPPPLDFIRTCTLIGMATFARDPECFDKIARDAGYFIANGKFPDSSPQFKSLKEPIKLFYL